MQREEWALFVAHNTLSFSALKRHHALERRLEALHRRRSSLRAAAVFDALQQRLAWRLYAWGQQSRLRARRGLALRAALFSAWVDARCVLKLQRSFAERVCREQYRILLIPVLRAWFDLATDAAHTRPEEENRGVLISSPAVNTSNHAGPGRPLALSLPVNLNQMRSDGSRIILRPQNARPACVEISSTNGKVDVDLLQPDFGLLRFTEHNREAKKEAARSEKGSSGFSRMNGRTVDQLGISRVLPPRHKMGEGQQKGLWGFSFRAHYPAVDYGGSMISADEEGSTRIDRDVWGFTCPTIGLQCELLVVPPKWEEWKHATFQVSDVKRGDWRGKSQWMVQLKVKEASGYRDCPTRFLKAHDLKFSPPLSSVPFSRARVEQVDVQEEHLTDSSLPMHTFVWEDEEMLSTNFTTTLDDAAPGRASPVDAAAETRVPKQNKKAKTVPQEEEEAKPLNPRSRKAPKRLISAEPVVTTAPPDTALTASTVSPVASMTKKARASTKEDKSVERGDKRKRDDAEGRHAEHESPEAGTGEAVENASSTARETIRYAIHDKNNTCFLTLPELRAISRVHFVYWKRHRERSSRSPLSVLDFNTLESASETMLRGIRLRVESKQSGNSIGLKLCCLEAYETAGHTSAQVRAGRAGQGTTSVLTQSSYHHAERDDLSVMIKTTGLCSKTPKLDTCIWCHPCCR